MDWCYDITAPGREVVLRNEASEFYKLVVEFRHMPVFLLTFAISAQAARWTQFVFQTYAVSDRIEQLAMVFAGAVRGLNDPALGPAARREHFTFYRWLNAFHYAVFCGLDERLPTEPVRVASQLRIMGLLTEEEGRRLVAGEPCMTNVLLGWVNAHFHEMVMQVPGLVPNASPYQGCAAFSCHQRGAADLAMMVHGCNAGDDVRRCDSVHKL